MTSFTPVRPTAKVAWKTLGQKSVSKGFEKDVIYVPSNKAICSKLKIKVTKASIRMVSMRVRYENGEIDKINLRQSIPKGGESRIIDLNGNRRAIDKVTFWYDTKGHSQNAVLTLFGRK